MGVHGEVCLGQIGQLPTAYWRSPLVVRRGERRFPGITWETDGRASPGRPTGRTPLTAMPTKGTTMVDSDKLKNAAESKKGEAKERLGGATGDEDMQAEGAADKSKADLKQAGEKVKDVFK